MNEKRKFLAMIFGCLLMLVLSAVLPLAFRASPPPDRNFPEASHCRIFLDFWAGNDAGVSAKVSEEVDEQLRANCLARLKTISSAYLPDRELNIEEPDGIEITELRSGSEQFRVCRIWVNARGDWQNWIDACFDPDTGRVFYFYSDAACLSHPGSYGTLMVPTDGAAAADVLSALNEDNLQYYFAGEGETSHAVYDLSDGVISYAFSLNYRPGTLLQISLVCE